MTGTVQQDVSRFPIQAVINTFRSTAPESLTCYTYTLFTHLFRPYTKSGPQLPPRKMPHVQLTLSHRPCFHFKPGRVYRTCRLQEALQINNLAVAMYCREMSALVFKGMILYEGWSENESKRRAIPQTKNLEHPANSLDLAPSDHHPAMKQNPSSHRFNKPGNVRIR